MMLHGDGGLTMCKYCENSKALYQKCRYGDLYLNTFRKSRTLEVKLKGCPPFADCCMKDIPISVVFLIKYCPECGRKLESED